MLDTHFGFNSSEIYKCCSKSVCASVFDGKFGRKQYCRIGKGEVLFWIERDEAIRNTFMYNNNMIRITGSALDGIRKIEPEDE